MSISTEPLNERSPNRLAAIRRLYFYLVALVSFVAGLAAVDALLRYLSEAWLADSALVAVYDEQFARQVLARSGGALLVAAPIFLLHWGYMQRKQAEPDERGAAIRKFFLYVASAVTVGYVLVSSFTLLRGVARLALGDALATNPLWPSDWLHQILILLVAAALQFYFQKVLTSDGDYGREQGAAGGWRRLYQAIAGLVGLGLLLQGGADLLQSGWRALADLWSQTDVIGVDWWRDQVADGIALLLLGALFTRINWQRWRQITLAAPAEAQSALRRLYLYGAVILGALATLIPAAEVLEQLLLWLLDSTYSDWNSLPDRLVSPFSYALPGLLIWVWHWRYLKGEADRYGESSEGATVRRLYFYAVAATGLVLFWFGAVNLLQASLDRVLVENTENGRIWVEVLARGLSLLVVGAPIWSLHWRAVQAIACRPDQEGARERASLPRRIYLYGVALVGALLILFYLVQVANRLLLLLLGDPEATLFSAATVGDIARSVIAAILWSVHLWAIRGDGRLGGVEPPLPAATAEVDRAALVRRIEQLETELAEARAALAEIDQVRG